MTRHSEYDCHDGEENQRYTKEAVVKRVRDIKSGENMLVQGSRKLQATIFFFTNKTLLELKKKKKVKEESEKVDLKLNIQKTKIMASGPITSWEIDGETVETVSDFILGGSKITADGDCSHKIKRHLLLGSYDHLRQHIQKQRHYFANTCLSSQGYGFSSSHVWM